MELPDGVPTDGLWCWGDALPHVEGTPFLHLQGAFPWRSLCGAQPAGNAWITSVLSWSDCPDCVAEAERLMREDPEYVSGLLF